jgi:DNA-binding transcriptional regulator LsrR (DeoR family)
MARVPDEARKDFLVEVAKLYYERELSQAEIARKFDVSRSLVSYLLKRGAEAGIALFGIGSNLPAISSLVRTGALTGEESRLLVQEGAVGTVCGLHIDAAGKVSSGSLNQRLVGITFETLVQIPFRLGLAAGTEKSVAMRGALRGGFVTVLVVDEEIAETLVGGD